MPEIVKNPNRHRYPILTVRLPPAYKNRLQERARQQGTTVNEQVRLALDLFLAKK